MKTGTIAIVGRPNVGKSTLFNRIAGERLSIVEDIPGVTRDRIYSSADWTGNHFQIIDTGGIQLEDQPFQEEIRAQVQIAIEEADVILMVCNGKSGMSDDDRYIAGLLQRSRKPIVLAVNQIDDTTKMMNIYEFYNLGIGDPIAVSGVHGIGVGDVLERCVELLPEDNKNKRKEGIHIAVIGEPNVGKSSIVNAILREDRSIVSNQEKIAQEAQRCHRPELSRCGPFPWAGEALEAIVTRTPAIRRGTERRHEQAISRLDARAFPRPQGPPP